eukprot:GHVT01103690.1.p2 GENE.GHVT01103690.1~~GHVT01103690.1.p2  ORF type:complete len:110 (+),score=3.02 GHVT01103690.1:607-936(+)
MQVRTYIITLVFPCWQTAAHGKSPKILVFINFIMALVIQKVFGVMTFTSLSSFLRFPLCLFSSPADMIRNATTGTPPKIFAATRALPGASNTFLSVLREDLRVALLNNL